MRPLAGRQRGRICVGDSLIVLAVGGDIEFVFIQADLKGGLAVKVAPGEDACDRAGTRVDPGLKGPAGKPRIAFFLSQRNRKASGLQFAAIQNGELEAASRGGAHGVQRAALGVDFSLVLKTVVVGVLLARVGLPLLLFDIDKAILVIVLLAVLDAIAVGVGLGRVGVGEVFVVVVEAVLVEVGVFAVLVIAGGGEVAEVLLLPPVGDLVAVAVSDKELVDIIVGGDDHHAEAVVRICLGLVGIVGIASHLGLEEAVCCKSRLSSPEVVEGSIVGVQGIGLLGLLRLCWIRGCSNCRIRRIQACFCGGHIVLRRLDCGFKLCAPGGDAGVRRLAAVVEGEVEDHVRGALDFHCPARGDLLRRAFDIPDAQFIDKHGEAAGLFGEGANHEVAHGRRAIEATIAEGGVFRQFKTADVRMELDAVGVVVDVGRSLADGDGDVNPAVSRGECVVRVADRFQRVRVGVGGDAHLHVGHLEGAVFQEEPEVGEFSAKCRVGLLEDCAV